MINDTSTTLNAPALDQRIASLNDVAAHARADAESALNRAFALAAALVLLVFACAVLYRWTGGRALPKPENH